jgi:hypothetical protein
MRRFTFVAAMSAIALLLPGAAAAQSDPEPWQPAAPDGLPVDFDWIRLPSDEWLKGEILHMYDDELEFDSDELGVLSFDFGWSY